VIAAWRSLTRLLRGTERIVALSLAFALLQAALLLPIGFAVKRIFDVHIPEENVERIVVLSAVIYAGYLLSATFGFVTRYVALGATKKAITELRGELLARLYGFRQAYFDRADLGRLHATVVQDTERLDIMANALVAQLLPSVVVGGILCLVLAYLQIWLFLLLVGIMALAVFTARPLGAAVGRATERYHRAFDTFSTQTGLALRAMYLTKTRAAEESELAGRKEQFAELGEVSRRMAWLGHAYTLGNGAVAATANVAVTALGGVWVAQGRITLGDLLAFFAVSTLLRARISALFISLTQVISGLKSLDRLQALLAVEEPEPYRGGAAHEFSGGIRLEDVRFAYGERPLLSGASLELEPGEHVALIGPNGSGKSTIVSLILGLYRPAEGRLLADGRPYDELDLRCVRRAVGVVLQDPLLFHGTVRENIAFGVPSATDEQVEEAARRAGAADFVERLRDGYGTDVGAEGVQLSGGQRQRLAIARALLGRPALVVLDEPATYLDAAATQALVESLRALPWNPSLLLIGHEALLLPEVDRVYRIAGGRTEVVAEGRGAPMPA
jgi:ABC-type bacteriocin/lantibiotic exporter with double-glycine peptidase domain